METRERIVSIECSRVRMGERKEGGEEKDGKRGF